MRVLRDLNTWVVLIAVGALYVFGDAAILAWTTTTGGRGPDAAWINLHRALVRLVSSDESVLFVVLLHFALETTFWTAATLVEVLGALGVLERFALQRPFADERERAAWTAQTRSAKREVLVGHWLVRPFVLYGFHRLLWSRGRIRPLADPLPELRVAVPQFVACVLTDDTYFYWAHRLCHSVPAIYKTIHKKHHEFHRPSLYATEHAHPLEDVFVNSLGTLLGPLLLGTHPVLLITYVCAKLYQSMEAHSGYNLPFPLSWSSVLDSMDCAPAHDFHHSHNVGNYGGFFMFWDWICGTDAAYERYVLTKRRRDRVYDSARRPYLSRRAASLGHDDD